MYEAILWDMDGTLVDTEPLWARATYAMSEDMGRRIPPEVQAQTVGGTFRNTAQICADYAGITLTEAELEHHRETMFARVTQLFSTELTLLPGIPEILDALAAADTPMMVVTNTPRQLAQPVIDAIGPERFRGSICGDEVSRGKPDPEIYATAASRLGVAPASCLVFEDSTTGMTAAHRAGCAVVGLPATEDQAVPEGVVTLAQLRTGSSAFADGRPTFSGVTPGDLATWFELISNRNLQRMQE